MLGNHMPEGFFTGDRAYCRWLVGWFGLRIALISWGLYLYTAPQ
jgi:hypothetical protein